MDMLSEHHKLSNIQYLIEVVSTQFSSTQAADSIRANNHVQ